MENIFIYMIGHCTPWWSCYCRELSGLERTFGSWIGPTACEVRIQKMIYKLAFSCWKLERSCSFYHFSLPMAFKKHPSVIIMMIEAAESLFTFPFSLSYQCDSHLIKVSLICHIWNGWNYEDKSRSSKFLHCSI
jgi:hypothetical protein